MFEARVKVWNSLFAELIPPARLRVPVGLLPDRYDDASPSWRVQRLSLRLVKPMA